MLSITSILMVPVIIVVTGGSVVLISKIGGKKASKNIQRMKWILDDEKKERQV